MAEMTLTTISNMYKQAYGPLFNQLYNNNSIILEMDKAARKKRRQEARIKRNEKAIKKLLGVKE